MTTAERRAYVIRLKKSPRSRNVETWTRFHVSAEQARESVEGILSASPGYGRAVILSVEEVGR